MTIQEIRNSIQNHVISGTTALFNEMDRIDGVIRSTVNLKVRLCGNTMDFGLGGASLALGLASVAFYGLRGRALVGFVAFSMAAALIHDIAVHQGWLVPQRAPRVPVVGDAANKVLNQAADVAAQVVDATKLAAKAAWTGTDPKPEDVIPNREKMIMLPTVAAGIRKLDDALSPVLVPMIQRAQAWCEKNLQRKV